MINSMAKLSPTATNATVPDTGPGTEERKTQMLSLKFTTNTSLDTDAQSNRPNSDLFHETVECLAARSVSLPNEIPNLYPRYPSKSH